MTFAHPERLWLVVLVIAALVAIVRAVAQRVRQQTLAYSNIEFLVAAMRPSRIPAMAIGTLLLAGVLALGCAVAHPRLIARVPVKDATVILALDTSGSMASTDIVPTRIEAATSAARTFLDEIPLETEVGVVTFATGASLLVAPTSDFDTVRNALDHVPAPNGATSIGDALLLAGRQMPPHGKRVIILLTDGVNTTGASPIAAAQTLAQLGVQVYTVGVGSNGSGLLIPGTNEEADLDEETLRSVASQTGGTYSAVSDAGTLSSTFRNLARSTVWEPRRVDGSLGFALGGGGLVLLAFLGSLVTGRFP